jgi:hypothetical protein
VVNGALTGWALDLARRNASAQVAALVGSAFADGPPCPEFPGDEGAATHRPADNMNRGSVLPSQFRSSSGR